VVMDSAPESVLSLLQVYPVANSAPINNPD
jgi:hypothetical protein